MSRWSRAVAVASLVTSITMAATVVPATAQSAHDVTLTSAELATQTSFESMLTGLQHVVTQLQANPMVAKGLTLSGTNPSGQIAAVQQAVSNFAPVELDALGAAMTAEPSWQQAPTQLSSAVGTFETATSSAVTQKNFTGTFSDYCTTLAEGVNPQYVYDEYTATFAANQIQSAAQAAMLAAPGVVAAFIGVDIPTGVKIALAVVWGIANAVYLALSQALAVGQDCVATAFSNLQSAALPTGTGSDVLTYQVSSDASVQALITAAQSTAAQITTVLSAVDAVKTQANSLISSTNDLNTTVSDINTRVTNVQDNLKSLQTNVDVLKNTEVSILAKSDAEISNLSTFQQLQVRMLIEENLTRAGASPIGLFQLPAPQGYLDFVKIIVHQTVAQLGASNAKASADLAAADSYFVHGQYKLAYYSYAKAYQDVR